MPKILLHREPAWMERFRAYKVFVDGSERGSIKQNEDFEIEVPEGRHRIQLRVDFCASPNLEVNATDDVRLRCQANVHPMLAIYFLLFRQREWIRLWQED